MAYNLTGGTPVYSSSEKKNGSYSLQSSGGISGSAGIIPTSKDFTISLWIKLYNPGGTQVAVGQQNNFWIGTINGVATMAIGHAGAEAITSGSLINDSAWHNIVYSIKASGSGQYYWAWLDGVRLSATQYPTLGIDIDQAFDVGHLQGGSANQAWIDDLAIWEGAKFGIGDTITPPATIDPSDPTLIAYYPFENSLVNAKSVGITSVADTTTRNGNQSSAIAPFSPFSSVTGGTLPYTYSFTGTLQAGLTLNTSTGVVSGTPTSIENQSVTFSVKDATNAVSSTTSTVQINIAAPAAITATANTTSKTFTTGDAITSFQPLTASGGVTPYTYMVSPALSAGLSLNTATGAVTGTPTTTAGATSYTFSVKDANNVTASTTSAVSITVNQGSIFSWVNTQDQAGNNIRVLIPNVNSAHPYNSSNPTGVIVYFHGRGGNYTSLTESTIIAGAVTALLNEGYILASSDGAGDGFGSQPSIDAYAQLCFYLKANYNVAGFLFWGESAGGPPSLNLIRQHKVKSVYGFLGTYPILSVRSSFTGETTPYLNTNFSTDIKTAYGFASDGQYYYKTFGHDPLLSDATAFNVHIRIYASYDDDVVNKLYNADPFKTLVENSVPSFTLVECAGNHGSSDHVRISEYVAFANYCFANPPATTGKVGETTTVTTNATQSGYFINGTLHKIN